MSSNDKLKISSWNILSTERIVGVNEKKKYGNDEYSMVERRYLLIADEIIDMFKKNKVDIFFIQEADEFFLHYFDFLNQRMGLKYIHHFIKGNAKSNICLMIIYNPSKFAPMGKFFDFNLINLCESYNNGYPLRGIPLFLYNINNNMPIFLLNIHNSSFDSTHIFEQILEAFINCFHGNHFNFLSQNIPMIIGGDLYLTYESLKKNFPPEFMVDANGMNDVKNLKNLVTGNSVHPFLEKNTKIQFKDDDNPVSDILVLHNPAINECLKIVKNNQREHAKNNFRSPYEYKNLKKNDTYTLQQLEALLVKDSNIPVLNKPLSDHNMISTTLQYNSLSINKTIDIHNFKEILFGHLKKPEIITEPRNIQYLNNYYYKQAQLRMTYPYLSQRQSRKPQPLTIRASISNSKTIKAGSKKKRKNKKSKKVRNKK